MQQEQFILPGGVTVRDPQGNRYVIESVLGKGELGAVYLVRERDNTHNLFALKEVINPNKDDRERFAFEAEVLKRLSHKALPRVYHVFENDRLKRVYLLMDYIDGMNLEILRGQQPEKCFPLSLVLNFMAPIVDALTYLHTQEPPIVHRDIKPANIIIPTGEGEAMVVDFGSAKEYIVGMATTFVDRRSAGYAALEQYKTGTNPATDIYGLGATFYTLLTGLVPIDAPTRVVNVVSTGVDPLRPANQLKPAIPLVVGEALQRAMAIKVADRFKTVDEFWQKLASGWTSQVNTRQAPNTTQGNLPQTFSLRQAIQDASTEPLARNLQEGVNQVEERISGLSWWIKGQRGWLVLRILAGVFIILSIETAFFSYLLSYTLLVYCCIGILLLSIGVLLYDLFTRLRRSRK
jgi:serine/threonine protein kinase